jgi:Putative Ice-binding-like adhesive domain
VQTDSGSPSADFVVRARLLFNFSSATAVTIATNMAFEGTVLAQLATVTIGQGQTNGAVIGAVVNGTGQTNFVLFDPDGCLPPLDTPVTPEVPFAVVLPLGAVAIGCAFVMVGRRRVAPTPA